MTSTSKSNLAQAWLVLVMAAVFGTALTGIQLKLNPIIEANKRKETVEKIPSLILGESKVSHTMISDLLIESRTIRIEKNGIRKFYPIFDVRAKDGTLLGHALKAIGQGYADKIEVLLGLDAKGKSITGLFVLDQKETPGLGNRIVEKTWRDQFVGKPVDLPLVVVKTGGKAPNEIDGISGATISSRSVAGIVNTVITDTGNMFAATTEKQDNNHMKDEAERADQ